MTGRGDRALLALSGVACVVGIGVFLLTSFIGRSAFSVSVLAWAVFPGVYWAVGATIVLRAHGHPVGRLLTVAGMLAAVVVGGAGFITSDPALAATSVAPWAILLVTAAYGPCFVALILASMVLFPDGRLPGSAWRLAIVLPLSMVAVATVALVLRPGPFGNGLADNPLGVQALPAGLLGSLYVLDPLGIALLGFVGAFSLIWRFRRGTQQVRAQLKWLIASVVPVVILVPISFFETDQATTSLADVLSAAALTLIPLAIGVAILRYRLYEIDRIISRTLSYAVVTATLALVFVAVVLGLQAVLEPITGGNTIAVAASTLVVAALFQPLRRRVQRVVDRRFDRTRYDGQRLADAFSERLRDQVDITAVTADLDTTIHMALGPTTLRLWLPGSPE